MIHIHGVNRPPLIQADDGGWEIDFTKKLPSEISNQRGLMYRNYVRERFNPGERLPRGLRPIRKKPKLKANGKVDWDLETEAQQEAETRQRESDERRRRIPLGDSLGHGFHSSGNCLYTLP